MLIRFQCPSCGRKVAAKQELAGKRAKCRSCGRIVEIPGPQAAGPIETVNLAEGMEEVPIPALEKDGRKSRGRPAAAVGPAATAPSGLRLPGGNKAEPSAAAEFGKRCGIRSLKVWIALIALAIAALSVGMTAGAYSEEAERTIGGWQAVTLTVLTVIFLGVALVWLLFAAPALGYGVAGAVSVAISHRRRSGVAPALWGMGTAVVPGTALLLLWFCVFLPALPGERDAGVAARLKSGFKTGVESVESAARALSSETARNVTVLKDRDEVLALLKSEEKLGEDGKGRAAFAKELDSLIAKRTDFDFQIGSGWTKSGKAYLVHHFAGEFFAAELTRRQAEGLEGLDRMALRWKKGGEQQPRYSKPLVRLGVPKIDNADRLPTSGKLTGEVPYRLVGSVPGKGLFQISYRIRFQTYTRTTASYYYLKEPLKKKGTLTFSFERFDTTDTRADIYGLSRGPVSPPFRGPLLILLSLAEVKANSGGPDKIVSNVQAVLVEVK